LQVLLNDYQLGAAVATALVNTAPEVQSGGDQLADAASLHSWLVEHRVWPDALAGGRTPSAADLAAVHALRSVLRELITAPDAAELAEAAGALAAEVGAGAVLRSDGTGDWQWQVPSRPGAPLADELALLTATAALAVLRALGPGRFRRCASPTCAGVYIDTSRGGRRRYCEPDICGNRINVAAYRSRLRAAGSAGRPGADGR
jgi:predicted RNA-binding Zn ribbon-like protein